MGEKDTLGLGGLQLRVIGYHVRTLAQPYDRWLGPKSAFFQIPPRSL